MRGEPLGDLQHRRATLADVGTGVVIPELKQFAALLLAQSQGTTGHRRLPHGGGCMADGTEYTRFTDFESRNSLGDGFSPDFSPAEWNRAALCVIGGIAPTTSDTDPRQ